MPSLNLGIEADLQSLSQADQIYAALKQALMTGDLKPGEALAVSEVAEIFSVSAMPVREAILKLAGEGLLKNERKKAARAPELSLKEFREISTIRGAVEGLAVKHAVPNLQPSDIDGLERLNAGVRKAALDGQLRQYLRLNHDFHFTIYRFCDMPVLLETIQRLMALVGPTLRRLGFEGMLDEDENWHQRIIAALRAGDRDAAAEAVWKDIESSVLYIESLETTPADESAALFSFA